MATSVVAGPRAAKALFSGWLGRANGIALWGAVVLLVVYPLLMVLVAAVAPAFPDSQPLTLADILSDRLRTASHQHAPSRCYGEPVELDERRRAGAPGRAKPARALARSADERPVSHAAVSRFAGLEPGCRLERLPGSVWLSRSLIGASYLLFLGTLLGDGGALRADCLFCGARADRENSVLALVGRANRRRRAGENPRANPVADHFSRPAGRRFLGFCLRHRRIRHAFDHRQPHRLSGHLHRDRPHCPRLSDQFDPG